MNKTHKIERLDWAKKYLKTDFYKVLRTGEVRVCLDRSLMDQLRAESSTLTSEGGVLVWSLYHER